MTSDARSGPAAAGAVDADRLAGWLAELFAPWVQALRLTPLEARPGEALLALPFDASLAR